jgi:hypothetical protein
MAVQLSLVGKDKIIKTFLDNVVSLRARVLTARTSQTPANLEALRYILSPNPGTKIDSLSSSRTTEVGNVVKARLNWKTLYP